MKAQRSTAPTQTHQNSKCDLKISPRDVKNEDRPGYVYENKTGRTKCHAKNAAFYMKTHLLRKTRQQFAGLGGRKMHKSGDNSRREKPMAEFVTLAGISDPLTERYGVQGKAAAERLQLWLLGAIPMTFPDTLAKHLEEQYLPLLFDAFWQVLPFGTGGRRGSGRASFWKISSHGKWRHARRSAKPPARSYGEVRRLQTRGGDRSHPRQRATYAGNAGFQFSGSPPGHQYALHFRFSTTPAPMAPPLLI